MTDSSVPGPPLPWTPTGAIGFGWDTMKRKPMSILVLFVAMIAANLVSGFGAGINAILGAQHDRGLALIGIVVYAGSSLVGLAVSFWIQMGITRYALKLARGQPADFGDIFTGGPYLSYLGAGILVGLGVFGGMLLCIVPGVILALGWMFHAQLIVDRRMTAVEAIRASWHLTTGHKGDLFLLALLSFGVALLGYIACCVGIFVAIPVLTIAMAHVYLKLTGEEPAVVAG